MMICGFYNISPFTPASLVVIAKDDSDNLQMIYPDGHVEDLTDAEFRELEPEFVQTEQKKIWEKEPLKTKFVLLPDSAIIAGTNAEVCSELIRWYKSFKKELDESTRSITEKYITFLLEKISKAEDELKYVRVSMLPSFVWFLKKTQNEELSECFEPLVSSRGRYWSPVSVVASTSAVYFHGRTAESGKVQNKWNKRDGKIVPGKIEIREEHLKIKMLEENKIKADRKRR